ncbi:hypothetical protein [Kitasatospora sp. NPDC094015]|uniref:hypothetical protein n=1 Tax=Kitasatospora sp. NPDC094015 TaxID=3155205 RepID=UPI00332B9310
MAEPSSATGPAAVAERAPTERTMGYCVDCRDYVLGRPVRAINDRAEAVDQHLRCPAPAGPAGRGPLQRPGRGR